MVIYNLLCKQEHQFEGWFPSAEGFEEQLRREQVSCPVCSSTAVQKLPHACAVHTKKEEAPHRREQVRPASPGEAKELLLRLQHYVRENFEDVGPRFADEARKMFKGEAESKPIYGTTEPAEKEDLDAEGVPYITLPKPELDS